MKKFINKKRRFTLIELLIVVVVIGVLSGVILGAINVSGLQSKSRDAQRKSDLTKVQTALELYFSDNRQYPTQANWAAVSSLQTALVSGGYISTLPTDPSYSTVFASACALADTWGYSYRANADAYVLISKMEVPTSAKSSPCSGLTSCSTFGCSGCTATVGCYGVQNPL